MEDRIKIETDKEGIEHETEEKSKYSDHGYWQRWIDAAKKAAKRHIDDAKAAWAEFENNPSNSKIVAGGEETKSRGFPIYWSSVKTMEPAYYSRTPRTAAKRRFDVDDEIALMASLIYERGAEYFKDAFDFDNVMSKGVSDYIHADKAALQLMYDYEIEESLERVPLMQIPTMDGGFAYADATTQEIYQGEVLQDASGIYFERPNSIKTNQDIYLAPLSYDEVLHCPNAKTEKEIKVKAYRFCLSKDEAKNRFSEDVLESVTWKTVKDEDKREEEFEESEYLEGWEIWCKANEKVYFWSEQYKLSLLDVKDDPYGLKDFFPSTKFIINSEPSKSLYPTPAYIQLKPIIDQLHENSSKVYGLIKGIRRRALVDGSLEEVRAAFEDLGDEEFIVVQNAQALLEKGGLANLIQYVPVQELVAAISELNALEEKFKNNFFEFFGVPDILRGSTDPLETAAAQGMKTAAAHDRFKYSKKQIGQMALEGIELMMDLALQEFDDAKWMQITGFRFMPEDEKQKFMPALQMLRDDVERFIRLEIDTDSMSFLDEQLKSQQVNAAVQTVTQGIATVGQMIRDNPGNLKLAEVGLQAVLMTLEAMPEGKRFAAGVKGAIETLIEEASKPMEPPPPPPDYEGMKLQLEGQKLQFEAQKTARELDRKDRELILEEQREGFKLQMEQRNDMFNQQFESLKEGFNQQIESALLQIENQKVAIENFKAQMQARESEMEEIRLARETDLKAYTEAVAVAQSQGPAEPQPPMIVQVPAPSMPPINLNIDAGQKSGRKRAIIQQDEMGNMTMVTEEIPENPLEALGEMISGNTEGL